MTFIGLFLMLACRGVEGDAVLGRDLAAVDPQFAAIPADARLGFAPMPGSHRTLAVPELNRIAAHFGVSGEFRDVCFEYPTRQLKTGEVRDALRGGLNLPDADIRVIDFSRYPAPKGDLVFPLQSLSRPSPLHAEDPVIWRGYIKFGGARKFTIWAKVRIQVTGTRVIAAEDLTAAQVIQPSQVRLETITGFPSLQPLAYSVEQVADHALRRAVRAGTPVLLDAVESGRIAQERQVKRGELVDVEVEAGLARLRFEGRAESSGSVGETVVVRNAKSGKTFQARVTGKSRVVVATGMVSE